MKKTKTLFSIAIFACITAIGYTTYDDTTMNDAEILMLTNIEALALNEDQSGTYKCASAYNTCWWFNCSKIYRCGNPCTDQSSDSYTLDGHCSK